MGMLSTGDLLPAAPLMRLVDGKIDLHAAPYAEFTRACGLDADLTSQGLGVRSRPYAMIVRSGRIERLTVEIGSFTGRTPASRRIAAT